MMRKYLLYPCLLLLLSPPLYGQPIFDVHLHYTAADAEHFSAAEILAILEANEVERAVVIGQPAELASALHRQAPERIVPFLGVYREREDKAGWPQDEGLPARVEQALQAGHWRGVGELHLFAEERHSPVFRRLVALAAEYGLVMMIHGDPAVIDTLYDYAPQQPVIWAHAGAYPHPPLLADYLARYPALYLDLSVRDGRIAPSGELAQEWYELFEQYPQRILLGVDTFSSNRWREFGRVITVTRQWLAQLPQDVAQKLAHDNARRLFSCHPGRGTDAASGCQSGE